MKSQSVGCAKITCCNVMRSTNVMVIAGTPEFGWHQIAVISRDVFAARCAILSAISRARSRHRHAVSALPWA